VYPVVLRLTGRRCLVVGAGPVARRKVQGLLAAGATVTVVAPDVDMDLADLPGVTVEQRRYRAEDLDGCWLAFAATNDAAVQQQVFDDGERLGVWVNSADDPARCAFYLPAVHRRPPVTVAVSTEGTSPALAGWLRDQVARAIPDRLDELVARLAAERRELQAAGIPTEGRDWSARIDALLAGLGADAESPKT
jgi:precorrin-2 dehydrogenase/sirohydrochlorin ferrochelatase